MGNITFFISKPVTVESRGVFAGGHDGVSPTSSIEYITINSIGNTTNFGDLTAARQAPAGCSNGVNDRGCFGGGYIPSYTDIIDYITINSTGDAADFGDLTRQKDRMSACSNGTNERGIFAGGYSDIGGDEDVIEYITISSTGDGTDFGDLTVGRRYAGGCSNGTNERGVFGGGKFPTVSNVIDYVTINSVGDAQDFGNLTQARTYVAAVSNATNERGIFSGGSNGYTVYYNILDYVTINSIGDATDFGDLTVGRESAGGCSNGTNERGVFGGGNDASNSDVIDYITINSIGDAQDFGDLTTATEQIAACSNA